MTRTPRHAAALAAVAVLAAGAAANTTSTVEASDPARVSVVLSVAPSFHASTLPAGARVQSRYARVGALLVSLPSSSVSQLRGLPGVRGARPDYALHVSGSTTPSTGGVLAPSTLGDAVGSAGSGAGVTVAVLDTGVADTVALDRASGRLVRGTDTSGDKGGARDGHGHGTFMANLVAGGTVNDQQVGVAPGARVVDVKVAAADGSTSLSKVLAGLDWVVDKRQALGIRVLNLSLSADRPQDGYAQDPLTDGAEAVRNAGVVVAVAAGNTAGRLGDPGHDPLLMAVGAADTRDKTAVTAGFSGSGVVAGMPRPDVVATGVSVLSVLPPDSLIAMTYPQASNGNGLYRGSGTSEATAVVSGAVAVFLSGKSGVSPDDVRASFATAARNLDGSADGAGLIKIPTKVVRWSAEAAGSGSSGSGDPSTSSTTWSSTTWSSTTWSSSTWSSTTWSSTTWSSTTWSSTTWSSTTWSSTTWSSRW